MTEAQRLDHLFGFVVGTWSYSEILSTFLGKINDKQKLRIIFTDNTAGTDVFAGDINPAGKLDALPLNTPPVASDIFADVSYPSMYYRFNMNYTTSSCILELSGLPVIVNLA